MWWETGKVDFELQAEDIQCIPNCFNEKTCMQDHLPRSGQGQRTKGDVRAPRNEPTRGIITLEAKGQVTQVVLLKFWETCTRQRETIVLKKFRKQMLSFLLFSRTPILIQPEPGQDEIRMLEPTEASLLRHRTIPGGVDSASSGEKPAEQLNNRNDSDLVSFPLQMNKH